MEFLASHLIVSSDNGGAPGFASNEPVDSRDDKFAAENPILYPRQWDRELVGCTAAV